MADLLVNKSFKFNMYYTVFKFLELLRKLLSVYLHQEHMVAALPSRRKMCFGEFVLFVSGALTHLQLFVQWEDLYEGFCEQGIAC